VSRDKQITIQSEDKGSANLWNGLESEGANILTSNRDTLKTSNIFGTP